MTVDKIFINARLDDGRSHAIAVSQGRIIAITGEDDCPAAAETVDLGGQLVLPVSSKAISTSTPVSGAMPGGRTSRAQTASMCMSA